MEREQLKKLIDSLESLKRATEAASRTFEEGPADDAATGWWIRDEFDA